jgi:hypothetical protein
LPIRASNCVVAYLDVLGYAKCVDDAIAEHRQDAFITALRLAYDTALFGLPRYARDSRHKPRLKAFSDNIVLSLPIRGDAEDELLQMLRTVAYFQARLVVAGFFVRGAIAIGLHYMDAEIVFGEALLEAYRLETTLAVNPRVVLAQSAVSNLNRHYLSYAEGQSPQGKVLAVDVDSKYFVDYMASFSDPVGAVAPELASMRTHRDCVTRALHESSQDPKVWAKYVWVARYHNACCARWGVEAFVDDALISRGPVVFYGG